ncbi:hypothetical protein [Brevibacillus choshinensis]|uniref:Uncharacterized protein n=1 Tax=Brevibacillus choshinensis TaxID=54911 RepID=A0ABX7FPW2_BRECH|nr:hypothetical protein [Brevibacillus choshinensis]QRG68283.1 hypothetical protein JNE38_03665 [Brevibacillus choshinensis]
MLPLFLSLFLMSSMEGTFRLHDGSPRFVFEQATQEFDAYLQHWKKGQKLQLKHPLFSLSEVASGPTSLQTIVFTGRTGGMPGEITLAFYTMEGDQVFAPRGTVQTVRVDAKQREFRIAAVVPRLLVGRAGMIQVTFAGEGGKRAAYYVKAEF